MDIADPSHCWQIQSAILFSAWFHPWFHHLYSQKLFYFTNLVLTNFPFWRTLYLLVHSTIGSVISSDQNCKNISWSDKLSKSSSGKLNWSPTKSMLGISGFVFRQLHLWFRRCLSVEMPSSESERCSDSVSEDSILFSVDPFDSSKLLSSLSLRNSRYVRRVMRRVDPRWLVAMFELGPVSCTSPAWFSPRITSFTGTSSASLLGISSSSFSESDNSLISEFKDCSKIIWSACTAV